MNCRSCHQPLSQEFVNLGLAPPSNSFLSPEELQQPESIYPLRLYVCDHCFLVQVDEYKKAEDIFSPGYVYYSSFSTSWLNHARQYTEHMIKRFGFGSLSLVIEIASNDGYLLQHFLQHNIPVLGIEPTLGTAEVARSKGIETVTEFFGVRLAEQLAAQGRRPDLLLGNNVLAHVPDLHDFVAGMKILLKEKGIITMEFPHLYQLVNDCQFDTIYHEHFSYFSFHTVQAIFQKHALNIFDVDEIPTHGGSLRIYARHQEIDDLPPTEKVGRLMQKEKDAGLMKPAYYAGFQEKVDSIKKDFVDFLKTQKAAGKKIAAYGAAAKGNTLLNYCGVNREDISFVVDASPYKQGKYLPGSHIPVVSEKEIEIHRPDFILILPWNIQEEIMQQLQYVRRWNCKFVIAIPTLQIL